MRHQFGPNDSVTLCGLTLQSLPDGDGIARTGPWDCNACSYTSSVAPAGRKEQRIAFLERKRLVTIEDAKVKLEAEDWHGIQDCGSDLRDIDNELDGLRFA